MKKQIILLTLLLSVFSSFLAQGQMLMGGWKIYTPFNGVDKIIATPDKVYYTSVGYLFSYDPENQETYAYTVQNKLNGSDITLAEYNPEGKYLFVAYADGNIDLIFDNGKVVNMSDLRDANMTNSRKVNNVFFADNRIYLATDFGVVIYDEKRFVVEQSGIYNRKVNAFVKCGSSYLLSVDGKIFSLPASSKINSLSRFTEVEGGNLKNDFTQMVVLENNRIMAVTEWVSYIFDYKEAENKLDLVYYFPDHYTKTTFIRYKNGWFLNTGESIQTLDFSGNKRETIALPTPLRKMVIGFWDNMDNLWAGNINGLAEYSFDGSAATLISGPTAPGSINPANVSEIKIADDGTIYITEVANSRYYNMSSLAIKTPINQIRNGNILNIKPDNIYFDSTNKAPGGTSPQNNGRIAIDPNNSSRIYVGNWHEGFMVFEDNNYVMTFNGTNSPIVDRHNGGSANAVTHEIAFDSKGNLWALQGYKQNQHLMVVLPAEIVKSGKEPKISDWKQVKIPSSTINVDKDGRITYAPKSGLLFVTSSSWHCPVLAYDNNGTFDIADDKYAAYGSFIDQDGREFQTGYHICVAEDKNGKIWLGTSDGVIEFPNPRSLLSDNTCRRPKVSRNDGTNTADYLLSGYTVVAIAVDHANRKWLATAEDGVYLVNPEGTEILQHFTTENSPLPSNFVGFVAVSPSDNKVYFGTSLGLAEYSSTAAPAADSFSEIVAYPNPVRPGYSGWITVKGLMDNSYVKITDSVGNLVYATVSDGGMITWNGCNSAGTEVPTGVYYVFASQKEDGSGSAVTKIMIVR